MLRFCQIFSKFTGLKWRLALLISIKIFEVFTLVILLCLFVFPATAYDDKDSWDIKGLDTARDIDYLSDVEKDVILEMNKVRANPKQYAELYIKPMLNNFDGLIYKEVGKIDLRTVEGKAAVEECIETLSKAVTVGALIPELGLSKAGKDHCNDQGPSGATGHTGLDGSSMLNRIKRHGAGYSAAGENISFGNNVARDIVLQLLIDDGVLSRGHLKNIMDKDFTQTGVAIGTHATYRHMCVIVYANGYKSN